MTSRRWLVAGIVATAALLLVGRAVATVAADRAWFTAAGAEDLFRFRLGTQLLLRGGAFALAFAVLLANLLVVRHSVVSLVLPRQLGDLVIGEAVPGRMLNGAAALLAAIGASLLCIPADDWVMLANARLAPAFAELDPYLQRDIGFWVAQLPFERAAHGFAVLTLATALAVVIGLYGLTPSLRWGRGGLYVSTWVRRHLAVLFAAIVALAAWRDRVAGADLLVEGSGPAGAFVAIDHQVLVPLRTALALGTLAAAVALGWAAWRGHRRTALTLLTLILLAGPGTRLLLPVLLGTVADATERRTVDRPYLATRHLFTRRAFGVDDIVLRPAPALGFDAAAMARGASAWDPGALLRAAESDRFAGPVGALAWGSAPDGLRATVFARPAGDAPPLAPWSAVAVRPALADAGEVLRRGSGGGRDETGAPPVLIEDGADGALVVPDSSGRLAAPPFVTRLERLTQAWALRAFRLLAVEPPERARLVSHRDVRDRIARLAPAFTLGPTVQAVAHGDSLYWVGELFLASADYPLAEPWTTDGATVRYRRLAARAVVQAQTGRVWLVPVGTPDPLTRAWRERAPALWVEPRTLPARLAESLPPAIDQAATQAAALARTGFVGDSTALRPLLTPDDADLELLLAGRPPFVLGDGRLAEAIPVIEPASELLQGALVAEGGAAPRTAWVAMPGAPRWPDLLAALQGAADSAGIGRDRRGSRRGHVRLLPGAAGPVLAQSFYDWTPEGTPQLRGIAVAAAGRVTVVPELAVALGLPPVGGGTAGEGETLRAQARALVERMEAAQRAGRWAEFGAAFEALGRLLRPARP